MSLHLRPLPTAQVVPFPNNIADNRLAVMAQLENLQSALIDQHGIKEGRLLFAEAAVTAIGRKARQENSSVATLWAVVFEFERAAGLPPGQDDPLFGGVGRPIS